MAVSKKEELGINYLRAVLICQTPGGCLEDILAITVCQNKFNGAATAIYCLCFCISS